MILTKKFLKKFCVAPEARIMEELEEEQKLGIIRRRKAEKHVAEMERLLNQCEGELETIQQSQKILEDVLGEKKYEMSNMHFEIANQTEKIVRANKMANRLIRELGLHMHENREQIELDLKLRCAKEKFEVIYRYV